MSQFHLISIIDQSGVQQALDFDYRQHNHKTLYNDVRSEIKKVFAEKLELIASLLPEGEITFNVNLEQEKKDETSETLASFDSGRSGDGVYVFHVYYSTICQIADSITKSSEFSVLHSFSDTILHELIHAADLCVLKESNAVHEHSYRLHASDSQQLLKDLNSSDYEWNVQWALLHFFQIFRNEGVAILGQRLFKDNLSIDVERPIQQVMMRFKGLLNQVFNLCSGLKYYHILEKTKAHQLLRELSMEAYQYGDLMLLELLKTLHPEEITRIENLIVKLSGVANISIDKQESVFFLKLAMQIDLSEYVLGIFNNEILNRDEPLSKQQLLECCAIIQNDSQQAAISEFSKNIGICGFNKNSELFIDIIRKALGSKMSVEELTEGYQTFLQKLYPEDIVHSIQKNAIQLLPLALKENNEVALWALTYLLDDQDLIHDELSILGWQDDWMVLDAAIRIIG